MNSQEVIAITDQTDAPALLQSCRRVAHKLMKQYEWTLLPADDLAKQMRGAIKPEAPEAELERVAKHYYTHALYQACLQEEDRQRRDRAYRELSRYLYRAAYNRWPELAEDAAQRALILVFEQIERCREPGAFLAFALWKLRHAFQIVQRARGKELTRDEITQRNPARKQPSAHSHLAQKEQLHILIEAIGRIPDGRKRQAIVLKYVAGLSDEEISARLDVTEGYVRVLRHRGIERLRENEQLRGYFDIGTESREERGKG